MERALNGMSAKPSDKQKRVAEKVRDRLAKGEAIMNRATVKAEYGASHYTVEAITYAERARAELLDQLKVNPDTLAPSAKAKLEVARRQMERRLADEHVKRMRALDEEVRQRVLSENKDYLAKLKLMEEEAYQTTKMYRQFMEHQKKIFSREQYMTIMLCVHADPNVTEERRAEATRLLIEKRFALTGEKK